jgi:hypothetical protein
MMRKSARCGVAVPALALTLNVALSEFALPVGVMVAGGAQGTESQARQAVRSVFVARRHRTRRCIAAGRVAIDPPNTPHAG